MSDPLKPYDGPEFEEFCIDKAGYLPATRDRSPCTTCALCDLCQAGFDEQVRRVAAGLDPSLTNDRAFAAEDLTPEKLLQDLSPAAADFVTRKIPGLAQEKIDVGPRGETAARSQEAIDAEGGAGQQAPA